MNRRYCALGLLILTIAWAVSVHAQGGAAATATASLPASTYDNPTGERNKINEFVSTQVNSLVNDADPAGQSKARESLVGALYVKGAAAQPSFMFEYGRALEAALSAKLDPKLKPTLRQRLNIAIVAARAAAVMGNDRLGPVVIALLNDPSEPIVLWGMKAAGPLVPEVMKLHPANAAAPPALVAAIGPAVLKHPTGEIFQEAYTALSMNNKLVFNELIKLWDNRLTQYQNNIPEDPSVDSKAVFAVTTTEMWKNVVQGKQDRDLVMQYVSDQLYAAAQRADELGQGEVWDQLIQVVGQSGAACFVVGSREKIAALANAAQPLAGVKPDNMKGQKVMPLVQPVLAEIRNAFPGVKPPQPLKQVGAVAQP